MMNLRKRAVVLFTAATMAAASLTGCGSFNNSDVVATVGDSTITAGAVNFYARWQQGAIEQSYGESMWSYEISSGTTYEDTVKEGIVDTFKQMCILEDHMAEYNVTLTAEEEAKIAETAKAFMDANSAEVNEKVSATEDVITEVLRLFTIGSKMSDAMTADVDTEVSDDEAAQKAMVYVAFPFTITNDDGSTTQLSESELELLKKEAENFQKEAKDAKDFSALAEENKYSPVKATFDSESTSPASELIKAADALKEGECTGVIETDSAYYVAKVTSLLDKDATETKKEQIVTERKNEAFTAIYEEWEKDVEFKLNDKVLAKIDFTKLGITFPEKATTDDTSEDTVAE